MIKIIGLPHCYERKLIENLTKLDINKEKEYKIIFKNFISLERMDSLWYGHDVVDIKYKGYTFHIEAIGDVYAELYTVDGAYVTHVKDKINNGNFYSEMKQYFKYDEMIHKAINGEHSQYNLNLDSGNWWECSCTDADGNWHDLTWCLDSDDIFSAISEAIVEFDNIIQTLLEEKYRLMLDVAYENYKQEWCSYRGYNLSEIDEETGINGECYVCKAEFEDNEFADEEYTSNTLNSKDFETWRLYHSNK